jgi:cytochrome P450
LLNASFSPKAVKELEAGIRALTISLIDQFRSRGHCDFCSEFAVVLPLTIFIQYADLPRSDLAYLTELVEEKVRPTGRWTAGEVMQRFAEYLDPFVRDRSTRPGSDLLSKILRGTVNDRPLTHDEGIRICTQVLQAGLDTVAALLSFTFFKLAAAPKVRRRIAAQPALIPKAVDEFTRLGAAVVIAREVNDDYDHHGVVMKKGDILVLPTMLHSLDESIFTEATEVDLDRPRQEILTFAQGPHRCPGAQLARSELGIVLHEWFARIPEFELRPGQEVQFVGGAVCSMKRLPLQWPVS